MLIVDVIRVQATEAALSQPLLDSEEFTFQRPQCLSDWVSPHILKFSRNEVIVLTIIRLYKIPRTMLSLYFFVFYILDWSGCSLPGTCSFNLSLLAQCSHQHINTFLI